MLYVGFNRFNGGLPPEIGNLSKLVHLHMYRCGLNGSIPAEIDGLKNVETMYLQGNALTGEIPVELSELHKLRELDLSENGLQGGIPYMIGNLQNLEVLRLSSNDFTGLLPQQLGVSGKLLEVYVSSNRFTGSIPPNLCNGGRLRMLSTGNNSFIGAIPNSLGTCNSLVEVFMGQNHLNGPLPIEISNVSALWHLNLARNQLAGPIPREIGNFSALEFIDLSQNEFIGPIPVEISTMNSLELLNVSRNQLAGPIPREIGNLSALRFIDLSQNEFIGPIPVEISTMSSLELLNVSRNHLNESIPVKLQNMQNLRELDFSYNNFSGIIQEGSWFFFLDPRYFAGNPNLCRPHLGNCTSRGQAHRKRGLLLVLAPLLFCLLLLLLLVAGAAIYKGRGRAVKKIVDTRLWEMTTFQKLDFGSDDIVQCLKEENIIGGGGAGVVYRGIMPNGQQIAVKKLTGIGMGSLNDHGFSAEVKTLGKIRHRHVVTLLAFCSNHETNLLVYDYMPNGSLGEVLQGSNGGDLQWDSRYKIAVEAAKGLRYLHHDCWPLILHRDVKSNNILLDSNFEAHIADFGLAKLLHHSGASECMSSIAGSFGYIAPEYAYTLKVEEKSDIYSFGVVLLELITGKRPVGECEFEEGMNLAGWVKKMTKLERGRVMEITDPKLSDFPMEEAMHMFFVALLCLQEQPKHRPSMREIVHMLTHCKPRL
eukprot:PITA_18214